MRKESLYGKIDKIMDEEAKAFCYNIERIKSQDFSNITEHTIFAEGGVQTRTESLCDEIVACAKKFRWNIENLRNRVAEAESFYDNFNALRNIILDVSSTEEAKKLSRIETLGGVANYIYRSSVSDLRKFSDEFPYNADIYKTYVFSLLCTFLHDSKRIKGMTLHDFVHKNDPQKFNESSSPNYYDHDLLESNVVMLRKSRNRLLARGKSYRKNSQWSAISKDSEHEWIFYYVLKNTDERVKDTFKRFGNLYKDIDKVLDSPKDDGYRERLKKAYKKFLSKLHKIDYKNYIELIKAILSHISKNKAYYGINLYRLERRLRPYETIRNVNLLFAPGDEDLFLWQTLILEDITFPWVYHNLWPIPYQKAELYAEEYSQFLQDIVILGCLIFDELVEKGAFGNDWENLFRNTLNEMAEDVLYAPSQLDFTVQEESQEKFEKILAAPVFSELCATAEINFEHFDLHELPF